MRRVVRLAGGALKHKRILWRVEFKVIIETVDNTTGRVRTLCHLALPAMIEKVML
jgi:hypothetical protein